MAETLDDARVAPAMYGGRSLFRFRQGEVFRGRHGCRSLDINRNIRGLRPRYRREVVVVSRSYSSFPYTLAAFIAS